MSHDSFFIDLRTRDRGELAGGRLEGKVYCQVCLCARLEREKALLSTRHWSMPSEIGEKGIFSRR